MILRVYALYHRSLAIIIFLMILWAAQITVSAVGMHTGYSEFSISHILIQGLSTSAQLSHYLPRLQVMSSST